MFGYRKIIKQKAQSPWWVYLLFSIGISFFVIWFIPFAYKNELLWFGILTIGTFLTAHFTMGLRSWISVDNEGKYFLSIYDNYSNSTSYIDCEKITDMKIAEYADLLQSTPSNYRNSAYHSAKRVFGYKGKALVFSYDSPSRLEGDGIQRSVELPAPKADEFFEVIINARSKMER